MDNSTYDDTDLPGEATLLPAVVTQVTIVVMYTTVIVVSVAGNGLVVFCILSTRRMRTPTNYFLLNLAAADILMAVVCVPFTFVANVLMSRWPFGRALCPIVTYVQTVSVHLGAFTLVGVSVDRFRAVARPLRPRASVRTACVVIWALSLAVPLPVAVTSRVVDGADRAGRQVELCDEVWPDPRHRYAYSLALMVAQYFLPLSVLVFTYAGIGCVIWTKKFPGEAEGKRDRKYSESKRRASMTSRCIDELQ